MCDGYNNLTMSTIHQHHNQMTKKNEISYQKTATQIDLMLPADLKEFALKALDLCKDVRKYTNEKRYT